MVAGGQPVHYDQSSWPLRQQLQLQLAMMGPDDGSSGACATGEHIEHLGNLDKPGAKWLLEQYVKLLLLAAPEHAD